MNNNFTKITELLTEYKLTIKDLEEYNIALNIKATRILVIIVSLLCGFAFCNTNGFDILGFIIAFLMCFLIFSVFGKIGNLIFKKATNPYRSNDELSSMKQLNLFYTRNPQKFISFLEKVKNKKNN